MRTIVFGLGFALATFTGCANEHVSAPTTPQQPLTHNLSAQAFRLSIDTRSGHIDVTPPRSANNSSPSTGPAASLIGQDAIDVTVDGPCTFTTIPNKPKLKRCTFGIDLRNQLLSTDLVTPTTLPQPPQGTSGILAFPFTVVSSDGDGEVAPSPEWDLGPVNFFNDFASCSSGGKSDCYRYELFPSPLYANTHSGYRQIGFDVPIAATTVSAYVVVAADLRDNPVRSVTLSPTTGLCGYVGLSTTYDPTVAVDWLYFYVGASTETSYDVGFCSFTNTLPAGTHVVSAKLRLFGFHYGTSVTAERVDYGPSLEATDVPMSAQGSAGMLQTEDPAYGVENLWVTANATTVVRAMLDESKTLFQFRFVAPLSATDFTTFAGPQLGTTTRPQLVIQYTLP